MDALDGVAKIGGAFAPLIKAGAEWKSGAALKSQGEARGRASDLQAAMLGQRAGQERASSQREMYNEIKKGKLVQSALQARAAAQGGASDPSVVKMAGDIAAEGNYRAMTALYKGEDLGRYLENQASLKSFEGAEYRRAGEIAKRSARMSAFTTLLSGFGNARPFLEKYNDKSPTADVVAPAWQNPDLLASEMAIP